MEEIAYIREIFSSIQGEGPAVGRRHLFIRFESCDANCAYCDTAASLAAGPTCRVQTGPADPTSASEIPNPLGADQLSRIVNGLNAPPAFHDAIALTGGEPLLQAPFIAHWAAKGPRPALPLFLETNGNLPEALEQVIDCVDVVSADVKIPSATGEPARYEENERFLAIASRKDCFVKVVYGRSTTPEEIVTVARLIARVDRTIPLILQPLTPGGRVKQAPSGELALILQAAARGILPDVRVIPQAHHALGLP